MFVYQPEYVETMVRRAGQRRTRNKDRTSIKFMVTLVSRYTMYSAKKENYIKKRNDLKICATSIDTHFATLRVRALFYPIRYVALKSITVASLIVSRLCAQLFQVGCESR